MRPSTTRCGTSADDRGPVVAAADAHRPVRRESGIRRAAVTAPTPADGTGHDAVLASGAHEWAHHTGGLRAFSHTFAVRSTCAAAGRWIADALAGLPTANGHRQLFSLVGSSEDGYLLYEDAQLVRRAPTAAPLLNRVLMGVNQQALAADPSSVIVHAAGAAKDGVGVLLPGHRRAGKSTLVACLVEAGFDYLSDEAVGVPLDEGPLVPFAKPVSIDPGSSQAALGRLRPRDPHGAPLSGNVVWQLPAHRIRAGAAVRSALPGLVLAPRYDPAGPTRLESVSAGAMVAVLAEQAFAFQDRPGATLRGLARVAASSDCCVLRVGDADEAVALVEAAVRARLARPTPLPAVPGPEPSGARQGSRTVAAPALASSVAWVTAGAEVVVYDARHRTLHVLDPSAAAVWQRLDGQRTAAVIAGEVAAFAGIPEGAARADIDACLDRLSALGLLAGREADPAEISRARLAGEQGPG